MKSKQQLQDENESLKKRIAVLEEAMQHSDPLAETSEQKESTGKLPLEAYSQILANTASAVFIKDLDGKYLFINETFENLHGITNQKISGLTDYDLFSRKEADLFSKHDREVIETGNSIRREEFLYLKENKRTVISNKFPIYDSDDKVYAICGIATDITSLKDTEEELNRLTDFLDRTGSMARVGGWEVDLETGLPFWTKTTREIHEVPDDYDPGLEDALDFFPGIARKELEDAIHLAIEEGKSYDLEIPMITAKGKHIWTNTIGIPEFKDGKCVRFSGTFRDITQEKEKAEKLKKVNKRLAEKNKQFQEVNQELKLTNKELIAAKVEVEKSELAFKNLFNSIRDAMLVTGTDRKISQCNPAFTELFGYSEKEILGRETSFIYKDIEEFEEMGKKLKGHIGDPSFLMTIIYKKKNGELFAGETNVFYLKDQKEEVTGFIGMIRDITERIESENQLMSLNEELAAQNEEYESLNEELRSANEELQVAKEATEEHEAMLMAALENSQAGIAIADVPSGALRFVNRAGLMIRDKEGAEIVDGIDVNKYVESWQILHLDGTPYKDEEVPLARAVLFGETSRKEFIIRRDDNEDRYVLANAAPVHDDKGKQIAAIVIFLDITERRMGQVKLQNTVVELKRMNKAYLKAKEKAEESDQLKSAFLANMSHEIRTPMNGIMGFTDLLKRPEISKQQRDKYIQIIQRGGRRMLDTVEDLIDISKIETGQIDVNSEAVNLLDELESILRFFSVEAEQNGLELQLRNNISPEQALILTDRSKINSILTNLLKNAIKFTPEGYIRISSEIKDGALYFHIEDTGIGIPEDKKEVIFDRFTQADSSLHKAYEGSGLGLAITKAYVEKLGGRIWVDSEQEKGTVFHITLPCTPVDKGSDMKSKSDISNIKPRSMEKIKVLITEDDVISSFYLEEVLSESGCEIISAQDGKTAVEICHAQPDIRLVLMDIKLPGMNGLTATRKIREFNKDVMIVAQTAYALEGDREQAIEAGCNGYLTKPIDERELLDLIEKL